MFPGPLNVTTGWVMVAVIVLVGFLKAIAGTRK
jgi:hypothetical protein